jgi:hypothetical protein
VFKRACSSISKPVQHEAAVLLRERWQFCDSAPAARPSLNSTSSPRGFPRWRLGRFRTSRAGDWAGSDRNASYAAGETSIIAASGTQISH